MQFPATNNEAEYEALLIGLGLAKALEAKALEAKAFIVQADSQLVRGDYEAKEERMLKPTIPATLWQCWLPIDPLSKEC